MTGRRLPDGNHGLDSKPGDYWRAADGSWECKTPNGLWGSLVEHDVTEHEDGTITVEPSILTWPGEYHGWLRRGEWTEA